MKHTEIVAAITVRLAETGLSAAEVSRRATGQKDAIKRIIEGHRPSPERLSRLCGALGLEYYVGPPRSGPESESSAAGFRREGLSEAQLRDLESHTRGLNRVVAAAGGDPVPEEMRREIEAAARAGAGGAAEPEADCETGADALAGVADLPGARPVATVELAAAAGGGAEAADERVTGVVWFRRDWLDRHAVDPARCAVMGVRGESMEPLLPDGCSILVDRSRRRRRAGRIYVLRTGEGIVVKRLRRASNGWLLASEHPAWPPVEWTAETELVGEVRWMSRTLG